MLSSGLDELFTTLGFGRWTLSVILTYISWALVLPYFSLGGAFYNPEVDHWCDVPQLSDNNWTLEQRLNYSVPWEERGGGLERSHCNVFIRNYSAVSNLPWTPDLQDDLTLATRNCDHWQYDTSTFTSTVTMEWDLVCERSGLSPLFQSLYFLGAAIGEPLLGFLSDRYGRRWVLMVAGVIFSLVAVASALLPLLTLVLASRFILGLLHPSCSVAYVKAMEVCPTKQRTIMGLLITAPFAFTGMMFGAWAYLVRDWRTLQLFCTLPAVLILLQIPFMDESPRWLMVQGRVGEAAKVLHKASCWQGDALPPQQQLTDHLQKLRNQQQTVPKSKAEEYGCVAVWFKDVVLMLRQPTLRKITLALFSCYFLTGITYWGISLSGTVFSDDPFLYMVMSSLMEVPGYSGFTPIVVKFGRRPVLSSCFAISGAAILAILITPTAYTTVTLVLALVGKLFITGAYNLLYLTASELLPTCVRSRGLNLSSMMARVGSIMSPFIIGLLALTYRWLPSLMFGTFAALASLIALLLPDSRHKPLPDTTQDVEQLYGRRTEASPTLITNSESLPPLKNHEDIEQETTTQ